MIIIFCIYFDYILAANQAMELENILRNCANQVDPDQENFESDNVDIPPPKISENCVLESQPPSYSRV